MAISALYGQYFQKSKIFLYPLLDIKKGSYAVPTETYCCWEGKYRPEDMKLVCVYHTKNDPQYIEFEKNILFKHNRLVDYNKIDSSTSIFVFDFSDFNEDWLHFINGKYSRINQVLKRKILNYFDDNSANYIYVNSYLFPENFFEQYAKILDVDEELLKSVGELCDKPYIERENLTIEAANLQKLKILN